MGRFDFRTEFGGWSGWPSEQDDLLLTYGNDDFDLAALDALAELLAEFHTVGAKAFAFLKSDKDFGPMDINPVPQSVDFTNILDHGQFSIDFAEVEEFGLHFTVEFRDGEPVDVYAGD